jgi:broad-specificity NMP kinase
MPQTMFVIGPKASGKTQVGANIAERTNMNLINFTDFVSTNGLRGKSDEEVTMALINSLSKEVCARVILESFPQNDFQAKFFIRNCKAPSNVFVLNCPQDICQERMNDIGQSTKGYVSSGILS